MQRHLVREIDNKLYVVGMDNEREDLVQEHLSCFVGGLFGLAGMHLNRTDLVRVGAGITETCYEMYQKQGMARLTRNV